MPRKRNARTTRQVVEQLRASEAELRALFAAMTDAIFVLDAEGRYRKIAPTNPAQLYRSSDELLGKTLQQIFPSEQAATFLEHIRRALATCRPINFEYCLPIGGSKMCFAATVAPMGDDAVVWVARDVTEKRRAEEAARQSEHRFEQVFHASPMPTTITTLADGKYVDVNDAWLDLFGYTREDVIGKTALSLGIWVHPEQRPAMIEQLRATGSLRNFEHRVRTKSGQARDVLLSAEIIQIGDALYNLALVQDITERKRADEALRAAYQTMEQRVAERTKELATLNSIAAVVSRSLDLKDILSDALERTMQSTEIETGSAYQLDEATQTLILMAQRGLSDDFAKLTTRLPIQVALAGKSVEVERPLVWDVMTDYPEGELKKQILKEGLRSIVAIPLTAKDKLVGALVLAARQPRAITPEEAALFSAIGQQVGVAVENARLYSEAEQAAAISERSRLARELHDSVTQSLYSMTLYAEAAARLLTIGKTEGATEHLRELRDTAQEALREMRLLIFQLRPPALERGGLANALQARLDAVEARGGMRAELQVEGSECLPRAVQEELYHLAQEALNNTLKHAHAQHVQVRMRFSDIMTRIEIEDDGMGFNVAAARASGGLGLRGMEERAQRIGGILDIVSAPGQGTKVSVEVPQGMQEG